MNSINSLRFNSVRVYAGHTNLDSLRVCEIYPVYDSRTNPYYKKRESKNTENFDEIIRRKLKEQK